MAPIEGHENLDTVGYATAYTIWRWQTKIVSQPKTTPPTLSMPQFCGNAVLRGAKSSTINRGVWSVYFNRLQENNFIVSINILFSISSNYTLGNSNTVGTTISSPTQGWAKWEHLTGPVKELRTGCSSGAMWRPKAWIWTGSSYQLWEPPKMTKGKASKKSTRRSRPR